MDPDGREVGRIWDGSREGKPKLEYTVFSIFFKIFTVIKLYSFFGCKDATKIEHSANVMHHE